jgi:hypothetical protein
VAAHVAAQLGLEHEFIDVDNPCMKPIAITIGDPAGIGPEIIAKAFAQEPELTRGCFVAGDLSACAAGAAIAAGAAEPPLPIALHRKTPPRPHACRPAASRCCR